MNPEDWVEAYPNANVRVRTYPDGGHDVQYRHLDQILLDMAGMGDQILVCEEGAEKMVSSETVPGRDPGTIGLCAWQN